MSALTPRDRLRGCLLGGAVGDALGAPVEFMTLAEIRQAYGPEGIRRMEAAYGRVGAITDDTQMTLFTAEGLIRACNRYANKGIVDVPGVVHRAYLRWRWTQGDRPNPAGPGVGTEGWLLTHRDLYARRAPGRTCLTALDGRDPGRLGAPVNDSKGCGGVMRVAPAAVMSDPFQAGAELAAITHGHPSGVLAAGVLAEIVSRLLRGSPLRDALVAATARLRQQEGGDEVFRALVRAADPGGGASPEEIERLGAGWVAEEALAIAVRCALACGDVRSAVLAAVNHSGDSDSTGAITGNIVGALHGPDAIPADWLAALELREVIEIVAGDLHDHLVESLQLVDGPHEREVSAESLHRYPGW